MGSTMTGVSSFSGKSKINGKMEEMFDDIIRFHTNIINNTILQLNKQLQEFGRQEILAWKEFRHLCDDAKRAKEAADKGAAQEGVTILRNAYQEFCYNPDISEKDKEAISKLIRDIYPGCLEQENQARCDELAEMCDEMIKQGEGKNTDVDKEAWKSFKESVLEAKKLASNRTLMQMAMIKCNATDAQLASKKLAEAGIPARVMYSADGKDGFLVVPKYNKEISALVQAAVIEARIQHEEANVLSEASLDMVMKLRGEDDRMEITGLTLTEAEAVQESMYGKKFPVVIKAPETKDGTFSIIYSARNSAYVSSILLQEMIREKGVGEEAHIGAILENNYKARQGVDILISKLSLGMDTFGYVVDADHPDHHLLITNKGITETFEGKKREDGSREEGKQEFVRFDKTPNPTNLEVEIKERIMQLAPRIAFFPAKEAKALGLTRDEFEVSDKLTERLDNLEAAGKPAEKPDEHEVPNELTEEQKESKASDALTKKLSEIQNPQSKMLIADQGSQEANEKYSSKVKSAMAAQTNFARYAAQEAMKALPEQANLPAITAYVRDNTQELLGKYKYLQEQKIQSHGDEKDQEWELNKLEEKMKVLRGQAQMGVSFEETLKGICSEVAGGKDSRVQVKMYQPSEKTGLSLEDAAIDMKGIQNFQYQTEKARVLLEQYQREEEAAQPGFVHKEQTEVAMADPHQKGPKKQPPKEQEAPAKEAPLRRSEIEKVARFNEAQVEKFKAFAMSSGKYSEKRAEALAVANVLQGGMNRAILQGSYIPPVDTYLKAYRINPEELAVRVDLTCQKKLNLSMEKYDQMPAKDKEKYTDQINMIIKFEVQHAVGDGMKMQAQELAQETADRQAEEKAMRIVRDAYAEEQAKDTAAGKAELSTRSENLPETKEPDTKTQGDFDEH